MRTLILGVSGMLGHKAYQEFSKSDIETFGIMRQPLSRFKRFSLFNKKKVTEGIDVTNLEALENTIKKIKPDVVINAIGVVKQVCDDPTAAISLNSLFPHQLAALCKKHDARLIQISTDCVFLGTKGDYTEEDAPNAEDLYGRSKLLGEVTYDNHLTIRTSIIGLELFTHHGLVEWFLSQKGEVKGYTNAVFCGLSTQELSRVLIHLAKNQNIIGLLNIGTKKINKCSLLKMVKKEFQRDDLVIRPYPDFKCDRSLNSSKMRDIGVKVKEFPEMVREMAQETLYSLR